MNKITTAFLIVICSFASVGCWQEKKTVEIGNSSHEGIVVFEAKDPQLGTLIVLSNDEEEKAEPWNESPYRPMTFIYYIDLEEKTHLIGPLKRLSELSADSLDVDEILYLDKSRSTKPALNIPRELNKFMRPIGLLINNSDTKKIFKAKPRVLYTNHKDNLYSLRFYGPDQTSPECLVKFKTMSSSGEIKIDTEVKGTGDEVYKATVLLSPDFELLEYIPKMAESDFVPDDQKSEGVHKIKYITPYKTIKFDKAKTFSCVKNIPSLKTLGGIAFHKVIADIRDKRSEKNIIK